MKTPRDFSPTPVPPVPVPITTQPAATYPIPFGARVYVSTQGDWWDTIAMRVYGMQRGNEHLMYRLIESNYYLRNISHFPAGVAVIVPEIDVATEVPLVPWKNASISPT